MKISKAHLATLQNEEFLATSDRYRSINTLDVINRFKGHGFEVTDYRESNYKNMEKANKTKHMVRMSIDHEGGLRRDIVIFNSHDSSTSFKLNFGAYRGVCMNTMVFGDNLLPEMKIKHTRQNVHEMLDQYADSIKGALEKETILRHKMEEQYLSAGDFEKLAKQAILIREDHLGIVLDPLELNRIRRKEDIGKNAWLGFNRFQEALVGGHYKKEGTITNDEGILVPTYKKAKDLRSPSELLRVNKEVHQLFAELVS